MTSKSDTSPPATTRESRSPPPNWDNVPFDVSCARCGQDIHGLTEPKCPACGLEFDWAEAVPIEQLTCERCGYHLYGLRDTRCPECGQPFTWDEALTAYHRQRIPLFEYQWRNRPVRSLLSTWCRAMMPGRLWRTLDIHDPPRVGPLCVAASVGALVPVLSVPVLMVLLEWAWYWRGAWPPPGSGVIAVLSSIFEQLVSPVPYAFLGVETLWCAASFASLMIFRQSMRRCRVRVVQVFRVWTYAVVLCLPIVLVGFAFLALRLTLEAMFPAVTWRLDDRYIGDIIGWSTVLTVLSCALWRLRQGYRYYLRMDHSLGVALASQVIACLSVLIILTLFTVFLVARR